MNTPVLDVDGRAYFSRLADVEARHWWSRAMWRIASYWLDAALKDPSRALRNPCPASLGPRARRPENPWHPDVGNACRGDSSTRSGLTALDVGCGAGLTARRLADRPDVAEVIGIDPSSEALRHARRFPDIAFFAGSALDLPFDAASFDLVTCFDVFQHLPPGGDRRASGEIARVLRPGGFALIRTNGRGFTGDDSTYRLDRLREIVEEAGLTVRRASHANMLPSLAQEARGSLACRLRSRVRSHPSGGGLTIQVPCPARNGFMGALANTEAWLIGRLGLTLPFGHSTLLLAEKPG